MRAGCVLMSRFSDVDSLLAATATPGLALLQACEQAVLYVGDQHRLVPRQLNARLLYLGVLLCSSSTRLRPSPATAAAAAGTDQLPRDMADRLLSDLRRMGVVIERRCRTLDLDPLPARATASAAAAVLVDDASIDITLSTASEAIGRAQGVLDAAAAKLAECHRLQARRDALPMLVRRVAGVARLAGDAILTRVQSAEMVDLALSVAGELLAAIASAPVRVRPRRATHVPTRVHAARVPHLRSRRT